MGRMTVGDLKSLLGSMPEGYGIGQGVITGEFVLYDEHGDVAGSITIQDEIVKYTCNIRING